MLQDDIILRTLSVYHRGELLQDKILSCVYRSYYSDNLLSCLLLPDLLQGRHLLDVLVAVELRQGHGLEYNLEKEEGDHKEDLSLLVYPSRLLHSVHRFATFSKESVPEFVILLILSLDSTKFPDTIHGFIIVIWCELFLNVDRDVCMIDHHHDYDVK